MLVLLTLDACLSVLGGLLLSRCSDRWSNGDRLPMRSHHFCESVEEPQAVVWTRIGFRVVLDRESRVSCVPDALHRAIVVVDVRQHKFCAVQRVRRNRIIMILRCDRAPSGRQLLDRMVAAAMAKLQSGRIGAAGQRQQLVAQADAEDRQSAKKAADDGNRAVQEILRISRAVG